MSDGVLFATGRCWGCGNLFVFDPDLVPSIPIDPTTNRPADLGGDPDRAVRQPVCSNCVALANANRSREGRELIHVPPGAYPFCDG